MCVCVWGGGGGGVVSDFNPLNIKTITMKIVQEDVGSDKLIVAEDHDSLCYLPFLDTALYFFPCFFMFIVFTFSMNVHVSRFFFLNIQFTTRKLKNRDGIPSLIENRDGNFPSLFRRSLKIRDQNVLSLFLETE